MRALPDEIWRLVIEGMLEDVVEGLMSDDFVVAIETLCDLPSVCAQLSLVNRLFESIAAPLRDSILTIGRARTWDEVGALKRSNATIRHFKLGRGDLRRIRFVYVRNVDDDFLEHIKPALSRARVIMSANVPQFDSANPSILWTDEIALSRIRLQFPALRSLCVRGLGPTEEDAVDRAAVSLQHLDAREVEADHLQQLPCLLRLDAPSLTRAKIEALPDGLIELVGLCQWRSSSESSMLELLPSSLRKLDLRLQPHNFSRSPAACPPCAALQTLRGSLDNGSLPTLAELRLSNDHWNCSDSDSADSQSDNGDNGSRIRATHRADRAERHRDLASTCRALGVSYNTMFEADRDTRVDCIAGPADLDGDWDPGASDEQMREWDSLRHARLRLEDELRAKAHADAMATIEEEAVESAIEREDQLSAQVIQQQARIEELERVLDTRTGQLKQIRESLRDTQEDLNETRDELEQIQDQLDPDGCYSD